MFGIIIAILLVGGGVLVWRWCNGARSPDENEIMPNTNDDQLVNDPNLVISENLEDIIFCGKTYQSKQVYIQGVNITQRIAELASDFLVNDPNNVDENTICINNGYSHRNNILSVEVTNSNGRYIILLGGDHYRIDPAEKTIHILSAYEGEFKTLLGKY